MQGLRKKLKALLFQWHQGGSAGGGFTDLANRLRNCNPEKIKTAVASFKKYAIAFFEPCLWRDRTERGFSGRYWFKIEE